MTTEAEIDRIDRCYNASTPMIISATGFGTATCFGLVAVVKPEDYDAWWDERGSKKGAPKREDIKPTDRTHELRISQDGIAFLAPVDKGVSS